MHAVREAQRELNEHESSVSSYRDEGLLSLSRSILCKPIRNQNNCLLSPHIISARVQLFGFTLTDYLIYFYTRLHLKSASCGLNLHLAAAVPEVLQTFWRLNVLNLHSIIF